MTKLTTVVWDWNGTLLDDVQVSYRTVNRVLAQNGYAPIPDLETYRAKFCFPIIQYYRNVGFDFERTPFETVAQEYMDLYHPAAEGCALQEGAEAALGALREAGLRQVLLSASLQAHLELQVARTPIRPYFDRLLGIGDIYAASKQELARAFLREAGLDPASVLFVGDSAHDFEVAQGCGCPCVLFSGGHQPHAVLAATGSPVIAALSELPPLLSSSFLKASSL